MNDLFPETAPRQIGEPARAAADHSSAEKSAGAAALKPGPEDYDRNGNLSIDYFAKLQRMYREAGEKSAREYHAAIAKARAAAQEGIDRAVAHAERDVPGWADVAFEFVKLHAIRNRGKRFTGYEIVQAALAYGVPKPPTDKAFGGPIQRASRAGVIRKVGTVPDPNPERHGSDVPLWEAA